MEKFILGQRVLVRREGRHGITVSATGAVARVRGDEGAWVALDVRSELDAVHPYPVGDSRADHVLAFAEDCDLLDESPDGDRFAYPPPEPERDTIPSEGEAA